MIGVVIFKAAFIKHYNTCIHPFTTCMYDENLLLTIYYLLLGYRFNSCVE